MAKESWSAKLKRELKETQEELEALKLNTDDNIYTSEENKAIKFYKYGFFILLGLQGIQLLIKLF